MKCEVGYMRGSGFGVLAGSRLLARNLRRCRADTLWASLPAAAGDGFVRRDESE